MSHRSTLCIRIYTIDIYIQEVSDLGRGMTRAVLPEFQLPLDSSGVLKITVLPFIIDEMAAGCVGEGSVPRTAPVVLSFVDPQEV